MPNRLTPVYSKNHYKEENFLKVKTVVFKYITPPHSNSWFILTFLYIPRTEFNTFSTQVHLIYSPWSVMWLGYPSSHGFTGSISPASCALILIQYKSSLSTYTILFIRSVTRTKFSGTWCAVLHLYVLSTIFCKQLYTLEAGYLDLLE